MRSRAPSTTSRPPTGASTAARTRAASRSRPSTGPGRRPSDAVPSRPPKHVVTVAGREVTITNPDKVMFPRAGHTKLDLVMYYLAVADGALRGAGDRPMALKRYVHGAE